MSEIKTKSPIEMMEEIELDSVPEVVVRGLRNYAFPAVTVYGMGSFYFNKAAAPLLVSPNVRIATTSEYVIFIPAPKNAEESFAVSRMRSNNGRHVRIPTSLRDKKFKVGTYRLYKYKDGLCFKRYEPLEEENKNA